MAQLGTKKRPAIVKVQTDERAMELYTLCIENEWQVIIGLEPDEDENIDDILKLQRGEKSKISLQSLPSKNAACPCESGKQYKRCCGK